MKTRSLRGALFVTGALLSLPAPGSEELGRLFFTPERRIALDRARQFNIEEQRVTQNEVLTVDGLVVRSTGRTTSWVNGVPIPEGGQAGLSATPLPRRAAVRVTPANEPGTTVTVGTGVNRGTGEPIDPLAGGLVTPGDPATRQ